MSKNPLAQFEISSILALPDLFGYQITLTNSALYMCLATFLSILMLVGGVLRVSLVPGKWQAAVEILYSMVNNTIVSSAGDAALKYRSIIFTIFMFVLMCNLIGMFPIPHAFTPTSHISVTLTLAMFVFIWCTFIAFQRQGLSFFRIFLPAGTPLWLAPMMILVEVFAYFARPVSLSVRLAANMIAGHTILKVIAGFVISANFYFAVFPLIFVILLIVFEIFIAILQAYIFTMLTCVYLNDSLNAH